MTLMVQLILAAVTAGLFWLCGKLGVGTDGVPATASTIAAVIAALLSWAVAAPLKWMQAKKISVAETKSPGITTAVKAILLLVLLLPLAGLGGCTNLQNLPANGPALQVGAQDATELALLAVKPADQVRVAGEVAGVAGDVQAAISGDVTDLHAAVAAAVSKAVAGKRDAVLITVIYDQASQAVDDVYLQAYAAATTTDKVKVAQALLQSVLAGVKGGAQLIISASTPPAPVTQPATAPAAGLRDAINALSARMLGQPPRSPFWEALFKRRHALEDQLDATP